tara:strand:- start:881 stop:1396 length:516 start_codon:yes stop_codon:yes gene_type:complete
MFKKKFYFLLILIISINSYVYANSSFVYLDMNSVLNNSKVGKNLINLLNKENNLLQKKFKDNEVKLATEEKNIFLKKNILSNEEFNKKIDELKKKILLYNTNKNKSLNDQNNKKITYQDKIINIINPILINYMEEKSILIILKKESIIVAPKELNITNEIIEKLNKKISKL